MVEAENFDGGYFLDVEKLHQLFKSAKLRKLPRCQDMLNNYEELIAPNPQDYSHRYFVSHRWDDEHDPDIRGWQLEALFQFASELISKRKTPACMWYDYSSLPQKPRTEAEELLFKKGLENLNYLNRTCTTIALISYTNKDANISIENMLKRGWILVELSIAQHHEKVYLFLFERMMDYISFSKANSEKWQNAIPNLINNLPFYDLLYIRKWFEVNEIEFTNGNEDLELVSRLLYEHIYNHITNVDKPNKLGFGKIVKLSSTEIIKYGINGYGLSPLFPDTYFQCSYMRVGEESSYIVTPVQIPPRLPLNQYTVLNKEEFERYAIDPETSTSPFLPGLALEYKKVGTSYQVKPTATKLKWIDIPV